MIELEKFKQKLSANQKQLLVAMHDEMSFGRLTIRKHVLEWMMRLHECDIEETLWLFEMSGIIRQIAGPPDVHELLAEYHLTGQLRVYFFQCFDEINALSGTIDASKSSEWHEAHESPPDEFKFGPVRGNKKQLVTWILPGTTDPRSLDSWLQNGAAWGRRENRVLFAIWFRDGKRYAEVNKEQLLKSHQTA